MCVGVFFEQANGGLVRANTKHKLRELLLVEPVAAPLAPGHWPENSCLCPCDVMATIAKAKKWRVDRVDEYGDVWVTPNVGAKQQ